MVLLDPHGDLAKNVLKFSHNTDMKRIVYISSSINKEIKSINPNEEKLTAVINPFDHDGQEDTINILSQELADAIIELLAETSHNLTPQMQAIIRPCITTVLRSPNPSINELKRFMLDGQNEDLIELWKRSPNPNHRDFFTNDFHIDEYRITKKSIRTKLTYFLADPTLFNMLNGKSTVNIEKCLNEGKIIIFNLPKGSWKFTSSVFWRLMIAYIHSIILRRDNLPREKRKQLFFFIDEFQNYITSSLAWNLAEARKYGLSVILASQSLKQIDNTILRKTVMVNTGIKAISQTDYEDRSSFAKEMGLKTTEIEKLKPLQFYIKNDLGQVPFKIQVPILGKEYYMTDQNTKRLLRFLAFHSRQYIKIPKIPLATPPPPPPKEERKSNLNYSGNKFSSHINKSNNRKDDPFDNNLKPAF